MSEVVLREKECPSLTRVDDPGRMGAYTMDFHNVRRLIAVGQILDPVATNSESGNP